MNTNHLQTHVQLSYIQQDLKKRSPLSCVLNLKSRGRRLDLTEIEYTITNGTPGKRRAKISKLQASRKQASFSPVNELFILECMEWALSLPRQESWLWHFLAVQSKASISASLTLSFLVCNLKAITLATSGCCYKDGLDCYLLWWLSDLYK